MKLLLICCLVAVCSAVPQYYNQPYQQPAYQQSYQRNVVPITSQTNEINVDGSYRYGYTSGDGKSVEESGYLKNPGTQAEAENVQGSFSYTSPEGIPISVRYIADENGFRAEGAHLPTPPPIPPAIQRALAYNAAHPYQEPQRYDNQAAYRPIPAQPAYRPFGRF